MGWYVDNLGDTPENRQRDGMAPKEQTVASAPTPLVPSSAAVNSAASSSTPLTPQATTEKTWQDFLPSGFDLSMPDAPEYNYTPQTFTTAVPNVAPASSNMSLVSTKAAKDQFNNEESSRQTQAQGLYNASLNQYQADLENRNSIIGAAQSALKDYLDSSYRNKALEADQASNYYNAAGLVPALTANDPSAQIRQLGQIYTDAMTKGDFVRANTANQQALTLAKNAGLVPQDYTGSVNGYAPLTLAGTPTFENQYKTDALNYQKQQDEIANVVAAMKAQKSGGGGSSSGGKTSTQYNDANTQDFLSNLMKFRTSKYAQDFYSKNYATATANGVDMDYILKKIKERWGVSNETPEDYEG